MRIKKIRKEHIKNMPRSFLLQDLKNIKKDITRVQHKFVKNFINVDTNFDENECCNLGIDDEDIIHRLNVLELENLNYSAVLEDCKCDLREELFLSAFWLTIKTNILDFIVPFHSKITPDDFSHDAKAFITVYKKMHNVDISLILSDVESVFRGLHKELNENCVDTDEIYVSFDENILDYDDYKLIEFTM